jgi:hypothetical protein
MERFSGWIASFNSEAAAVGRVELVYLVYLVYLVCLVGRIGKPTRGNR